jgi:Flp pilus assembly protein CpaB
MNKNVLIVLVVILVPIILAGLVAVAGAENFEKQKEAAENGQSQENSTEATGILVPMQILNTLSAYSNNLVGSNSLQVLG